ncbi:hypothetical protein [Microbispora sp. NPDC049125]|uniref:hypothetical protein n=1 Tax=Microbispora sp. NPDC049125 TaxID=3154929 RepID=UPI003466B554
MDSLPQHLWRVLDPENARPPTQAESDAIEGYYTKFKNKWGPERIAAVLKSDGISVPADTVRLWYHENAEK